MKFILQANGIHDDPYRNFATHEKGLGELTPRILDWLDENFTKSKNQTEIPERIIIQKIVHFQAYPSLNYPTATLSEM